MEWLNKQVRPEILALNAYSSARSEIAAARGMVQLDANENPYIPYPQSNDMSLVNRYPDPQPIELLARLAAIYRVSCQQIFVGRGMDEGIELLIRVFCIPYQDNILITPPTFGYYKVAADIAGVATLSVPYQADFSLDCQQLVASCNRHTKIVFLCTPNNPTGSELSLTEIEFICSSLPTTIIAVDEAYQEFSSTPSAQVLMAKYANLVVMKTLSKAYAFAGVRIGSVLAREAIIALLRKVMAPYPLAEPCIRLALQSLSPLGLQLTNQRIALIKAERQRMFAELSQLPELKVFPSAANFLLIQVADAAKLYAELFAQGIIIRNRSQDIANTLRLTIGSPLENNLLLAALGVSQPNLHRIDRSACVVRNTNETKVVVQVNLDQHLPVAIHSGIGFLDHMLEQLAKHAGFSLELHAEGDTHIDYHHSVEDVAIVLGQALKHALGDKRGINRYGFVLPMDEACAQATLDLSGRGILVYEAEYATNLIGDFPVELVEHFFLSLADQLEAAIHLKVTGANAHHMVEGTFKAFAKAFNQAILQTSQAIPSTKGVL